MNPTKSTNAPHAHDKTEVLRRIDALKHATTMGAALGFVALTGVIAAQHSGSVAPTAQAAAQVSSTAPATPAQSQSAQADQTQGGYSFGNSSTQAPVAATSVS